MHADEQRRVDGPEGHRNVHQPGEREHEDHKIDRALHAADLHTPELTGVHLALHARHKIQHRLVVARLGHLDGGPQLLQIPPKATVRDRQVTNLLPELARHLDRAELRVTA